MKISIIQNKWCDDIEKNLLDIYSTTEDLLSKTNVDYLLLPEFFLGPPWFQPGQTKLKGVTDDIIPGRISNMFCSLANKYKTNIILGTILERADDKYYNTSLFINREGNIVGKSQKMHTFAGESVTCEASKEINVFTTDLGKVGISVCSDFWILEHIKILVMKGAKIIFIPGGTLGQNIDPMIQALKSFAYLTSTIIVYASPIGDVIGQRGEKTVRLEYRGTSMIVSPEKVMKVASADNPEVLTVDFDDDYIDNYRNSCNNLCWKRLCNQNQTHFSEILDEYIYKDRNITDLMRPRMIFNDTQKQ